MKRIEHAEYIEPPDAPTLLIEIYGLNKGSSRVVSPKLIYFGKVEKTNSHTWR